MTPLQQSQHPWYKASLTPIATGLFTEAFYPDSTKGEKFVYFTQVDITPTLSKVIVASKLSEAGIRMMTLDLARRCLIPGNKATKAEMVILDELSNKLKV